MSERVIRVREGDAVDGRVERLLATEQVSVGPGTNSVRVYVVAVSDPPAEVGKRSGRKLTEYAQGLRMLLGIVVNELGWKIVRLGGRWMTS